MNIDWNIFLQELVKANPGFLTAFISVLLVPAVILLLTNNHQKALKKLEKELDQKGEKDRSIDKQEDLAYGALVNILFEVQRLYTELSLPACDPTCVDRSLDRFRRKLFEHQTKIAENQLYLKPALIELIYKFYSSISRLEIELKTLQNDPNDVVRACVSSKAAELSDVVIDFHKQILVTRNPRLVADILGMHYFKSCCGGPVSPELLAKYEQRIKTGSSR